MTGEETGPARSRGKIAREIRQRIEANRLFGWDMPLSAARMRPARGSLAGKRPSGRPSAADDRSGPVPASRTTAASRTAPSTGEPRAPGPPPERQASPGGGAASARKEELLRPIREEVAACVRCALCHTRTQTVFGVGDPGARLLFVGEAPGSEEDRKGEPFVGRAGRLLDDIIKAMGLHRSQVYIANIIKCRPPENRVPNPAEVGSCIGYLERQIEIIRPEAIVALGSVAARTLLGTDQSIGKLRSRFHEWKGIPVMPTYHPAYLLRNPAEKRKVWEDVQLVMERLGLKR